MNYPRSLFLLALLSLLLFSLAACSGSIIGSGLTGSNSGSSGSGSSGSGSSGSGSTGSGSTGSGSTGSGSTGSGSTGSGSSNSGSSTSTAIALSSLTQNNTAACPASGPLPVHCQQAFAGQADTRADVATPQYDALAGNISDEDPHAYLTLGTNTKILANMMLAYCTAAGTYCNNNVETGYTSDDPNSVAAQAADMMNRHIDGAVMTWEGPGTSEDAATLSFQSYANQNACGAQGCSLGYVIMDDGPSWSYSVASTGIPGTTGASCANYTGTDFESCVIQHLRNDMCYMNGMHWGNSAYLKSNGQPIVQIFPDEAVIPSTGPAPSWADIWAQIGTWNSDLPENCAVAPYNANNGVPLIVFENDGGFTHEDAAGSFYWIEPVNTADISNQFTLNISPVSADGTLDNFLATALQYPGELAWSNAFKGFNSIQSTWGAGRIMDQECGQTWITSLTESNQFYAAAGVPYLEIATWNDYNEGTEIESGIDNCYTISGNTAGQTLSWTLNATNSQYATVTTVSHIEVYDSPDGENLTLVATLPAAASGAWSLSNLPSGNHTLFVRMVGKNSILNEISSGIPYSN